MKIQFTVHGNPKAQKRHRDVSRGKFRTRYDPSETDKKDFLAIAHQNRPDVPIKQAISLTVGLHLPRPKNHYGTGRNASRLKAWAETASPTGRPDIDNYLKFVLDALNGVFWYDDSYITEISATKTYSDTPRIEITIECTEQKTGPPLSVLRQAVS